MNRMIIAATALLGLAHCAPAETPVAAGRPAGAARDCIRLDAVSARRALDERTIRFELLGGEVLVNRLSGRCPGLAQSVNGFGTLAFEVQSGQLCRGDRVRVVDPSGAGVGRAFRMAIPCPLGQFTPVAE